MEPKRVELLRSPKLAGTWKGGDGEAWREKLAGSLRCWYDPKTGTLYVLAKGWRLPSYYLNRPKGTQVKAWTDPELKKGSGSYYAVPIIWTIDETDERGTPDLTTGLVISPARSECRLVGAFGAYNVECEFIKPPKAPKSAARSGRMGRVGQPSPNFRGVSVCR
jgi:hypothetical protein